MTGPNYMSKPLEIQSFEQGVRQGLLRAAFGMPKSARAARILLDPLRRKELAALGERLFRESVNPTTPLAGLRSATMPGFGQVKSVRDLISRYPTMYRTAPPADRAAVKRMFQQQLGQQFAEIGHVAKPKLDFWGRTMPMAGAGTAGMGLGLAGGAAGGAVSRQREVEDQLQNMPMWDRMKYLLLPQSLNVRPQLPYELRAT